jgi:hypothetical protein
MLMQLIFHLKFRYGFDSYSSLRQGTWIKTHLECGFGDGTGFNLVWFKKDRSNIARVESGIGFDCIYSLDIRQVFNSGTGFTLLSISV